MRKASRFTGRLLSYFTIRTFRTKKDLSEI